MFPAIPILTPIFGIVSDWLEGRRTLAQAKVDGQIKVTEAITNSRIQIAQTQQQMDDNWNQASIANSGWKDEWFVILLSIPMVMCFVPGGATYVADGFRALNDNTPEWYQYAFLVAVASSFGFKKITDIITHVKK